MIAGIFGMGDQALDDIPSRFWRQTLCRRGQVEPDHWRRVDSGKLTEPSE